MRCFYIGHREAPCTLRPALEQAVERHITTLGVTEFLVGGYGAFDRLAAACVIAAKRRHTAVTLSLLLPYHPLERPVSLPDGFDCSYYPSGMESVPRRFAIARANRHAIDRTDFLIAYAWRPGSNACALVAYAQRRAQLRITLLERS